MLGRLVTDVSKIKENDFGYESYTALKKKPIPIEKKKKEKDKSRAYKKEKSKPSCLLKSQPFRIRGQTAFRQALANLPANPHAKLVCYISFRLCTVVEYRKLSNICHE